MSDELAELWANFKAAVIAEKGRHGAADMLEFCARVLRSEASVEAPTPETCRRCANFVGDRARSRVGTCRAQEPLKSIPDGRDIWPKTEADALRCELYEPARPRALTRGEDAA